MGRAQVEKLRDYADHGFKYGGSVGQLNQMARKKKEAERIEAAAEAMNEDLAALQVGPLFLLRYFRQDTTNITAAARIYKRVV